MTNSGLDTNDGLHHWLKWQETAHGKSWDFGLARIGQVWQRLGSPRLARRIITVAGTNGKGSCVRWLEELSVAHGVSVASFTSPHLLNYCERIRFDGRWVSEQALVDAFVAIDAARESISLSYFEWSALAAFYLMAQTDLDLAVLEVGLGGRLDATNIIDADAVIMTKIGLDHTQWLGETIEAIAAEKAAVMRSGQLAVFADQHPPQALFSHAKALGVTPQVFGQSFSVSKQQDLFDLSIYADDFKAGVKEYKDLPLPRFMYGEHQLAQFAACVRAFGQYFALESSALEQVLRTTANPARLMTIDYQARQWLLDVAHNADSAEVLSIYLEQITPAQKVPIICGMLKDKDARSVLLNLDEKVSCWYLISLEGERGAKQTWLYEQAKAAGIADEKLMLCGNIKGAVDALIKDNTNAELGVIMGSFLTVSAALRLMNISL